MSTLAIPKGYHSVFVTRDKECWVCRYNMKGKNNIIAHDTNTPFLKRLLGIIKENGDAHPAHFNCMKAVQWKFKKCGYCKERLQPFTSLPPLPSLTNHERISTLFFGAIGAIVVVTSSALSSRVTLYGAAWGFVSALGANAEEEHTKQNLRILEFLNEYRDQIASRRRRLKRIPSSPGHLGRLTLLPGRLERSPSSPGRLESLPRGGVQRLGRFVSTLPNLGLSGSALPLMLFAGDNDEGYINVITGIALGICAAKNEDMEATVGGMFGTVAVLYFGGGPELAVLGGALTSLAIKESAGLASRIYRFAQTFF